MTLQRSQVATNARGFAAKRQIKQAALAKILGLSTVAMSRRMRGEVSFSAEEIFTLSKTLDIPVEALYSDDPALAEPEPTGGDAA